MRELSSRSCTRRITREPDSLNAMARLMHEMHYGTRFTSLQDMLRKRVLRRNYPEGWGRELRQASEEGEDAS